VEDAAILNLTPSRYYPPDDSTCQIELRGKTHHFLSIAYLYLDNTIKDCPLKLDVVCTKLCIRKIKSGL
jgi:hypothetical protein